MQRLELHNEAQMQAWCRQLAGQIQHHRIMNLTLHLHGGLGAGKTTFSRYLLQALGVKGRIKSPTYSIVETYDIELIDKKGLVHHFDFYRFEHGWEWQEAGLEELLTEPGIKLIEWPTKANKLPVAPDLTIKIQNVHECALDNDNKSLRMVDLQCFSQVGIQLLTCNGVAYSSLD